MDAQYNGKSGGGLRCGGGCYPIVYCNNPTPVCCQTTNAGTTTFQCAAANACAGYPIECANENDCPGSEVCCHYSTHTVCATSCATDNNIACVPGSKFDCPAGETCDRLVTNSGVAAPYFTCGDD
jgi:hypothetical protein